MCPPDLIVRWNQQSAVLLLQNGSEILFRAFDDPRKTLSLNLSWWGCDQIEEIEEDLYLQLLGRLRDKSCRYAFGVGNPEPTWVKSRLKDASLTDDKIDFFEAASTSNPHLPSDYITSLTRYYPDFWVKRYVHGDWTSFEGQVLSLFDLSRDVIDPFDFPVKWSQVYVIDYGYRNPLACLHFVVDYDDNYYIVNEHYKSEQVITWHAERLTAMGIKAKSYVLIDPSCSAKTRVKDNIQVSIIDEFNDCGIYPIPANNDTAGLIRANILFGAGRLKIFKNCENTIREVSGLRWKKVKPNFNKNLPEEEEDKNNHTTDCIKYFVNSRVKAVEEEKPKHWPQRERELVLMGEGKYRKSDWYND